MSKHNKYKNNHYNSNSEFNNMHKVETSENVESMDNVYVATELELNDMIDKDNDNVMITEFTGNETDIDKVESTESETVINSNDSNNTEQEMTEYESIKNDIHNAIASTIEELSKPDEPEKSVEIKPVVLYKVGTNYIDNKCINQVAITTNLEDAEAECIKARDKQRKSYYVFNEYGNIVYSGEYTTPKDNYYRVGTEWKNGRCINQKLSCTNFEQACACANDNTKNVGVVHNVYDPSGKVVFSSKKKLILLSYKKRGNKNVNWYTK